MSLKIYINWPRVPQSALPADAPARRLSAADPPLCPSVYLASLRQAASFNFARFFWISPTIPVVPVRFSSSTVVPIWFPIGWGQISLDELFLADMSLPDSFNPAVAGVLMSLISATFKHVSLLLSTRNSASTDDPFSSAKVSAPCGTNAEYCLTGGKTRSRSRGSEVESVSSGGGKHVNN
jgi:hypothetical protein